MILRALATNGNVPDISTLMYPLIHLECRHRESTRIRVLMRQEKTMKIIVNSFLDPRIALVPNAGSDRSWVWVSFDFAEGELIETVSKRSCMLAWTAPKT